MAGFAKRPHRKTGYPSKEKKYEVSAGNEESEDSGSYITRSYYDDDDDDDDIPDTRKKRPSRVKKSIYDGENAGKSKKPNLFVRILHAVFPAKGDGVAESVRKIIFDVAVVAFIITGGSVLYDILNEEYQRTKVDIYVQGLYEPPADTENDDKAIIEKIKGELKLTDDDIDKIVEEKPGIQASFIGLYSQNPDIVGWVQVGDENDKWVNINYPVVQAADNDFYLTHNFLKQDTARGAIFADYHNKFDAGQLSANTILYGHNMWNGDTMFAKLSRYYDGGVPKGETTDPLLFYRDHPTVTFNTLYDNAQWKVFAAVLFNTQEELGEVYPYLNKRDFSNADKFNDFILDIMDRSSIWTDVDLKYGDSILTLSTCYYPFGKENADTRVAVFARKVREGESPEVDVSKAMVNPAPLKFTYQQQREGGSWNGRIWDPSKLLSYNG